MHYIFHSILCFHLIHSLFHYTPFALPLPLTLPFIPPRVPPSQTSVTRPFLYVLHAVTPAGDSTKLDDSGVYGYGRPAPIPRRRPLLRSVGRVVVVILAVTVVLAGDSGGTSGDVSVN